MPCTWLMPNILIGSGWLLCLIISAPTGKIVISNLRKFTLISSFCSSLSLAVQTVRLTVSSITGSPRSRIIHLQSAVHRLKVMNNPRSKGLNGVTDILPSSPFNGYPGTSFTIVMNDNQGVTNDLYTWTVDQD